MIWSHLVWHILYIASFCNNGIITPPIVDPPSHIGQSGTSDYIPPRIDISRIWIPRSPDIVPISCYTTIEPSSFEWMKSYFTIIGIWTSEINTVVCAIHITTPENTMSECTKRIYICWEFSIEYEFSLPCFFRFSTIWKIDTKYIHHWSRGLLGEDRVCYSTLIRYWIAGKTRCKFDSIRI